MINEILGEARKKVFVVRVFPWTVFLGPQPIFLMGYLCFYNVLNVVQYQVYQIFQEQQCLNWDCNWVALDVVFLSFRFSSIIWDSGMASFCSRRMIVPVDVLSWIVHGHPSAFWAYDFSHYALIPEAFHAIFILDEQNYTWFYFVRILF